MSQHQHRRSGGARHNSDWLSRFHRRHDARHHAEREQEAPLLVEEHADEQSEVDAEVDPEALPPADQHSLKRTVETVRRMITQGGKVVRRSTLSVAAAVGSGVGQTARRASTAGSKVKRSTQNHSRKIMAAILLLLLLLLAILIYLLTASQKEPTKDSCCSTPACIEAASNILQNLDPSVKQNVSTFSGLIPYSGAVDPCEHFDQYVCGGFDKRVNLRPEQDEVSTGSLIADATEEALRHILESSGNVTSKDKVILAKAQADFAACVNEQGIEDAGLAPLKEVVEEIKRLFPTTGPVMSGPRLPQHIVTARLRAVSIPTTQTLAYLMKVGVKALVSFDIGADSKTPSQQAIFASPVQAIGLPSPQYYKDESIMAGYREVIRSTLEVFYDTSVNTTAALYPLHGIRASSFNLSQAVADFEVQLSVIVPLCEEAMDPEKAYNKMTLSQFDTLLPQISLEALISELAPSMYRADSLDSVIVMSPDYIQKLSFLLQKTPKPTQQAFFVWKAIQKLADGVEDPAVASLKAFNTKLRGARDHKPAERWRQCVREANSDLGWIMSKFFVAENFSASSKDKAEEIVQHVKKTFAIILQHKSWMTENDRDVAIEKAKAIVEKIGYPTSLPNVLDSSSIASYYTDLTVTESSYFGNKLSVAKFDVTRQWSKLGKPTNKAEWDIYATAVNAYYNPSGNDVVFPAAILQLPIFYDSSVPNYLSHGSFGSVAGHEVSHAFDSTGSHYDLNGKLTEWWSNKTRNDFEKQAQCFVNQYSDFTIDGLNGSYHVNGKLTLAANIADAGGVHAAFEAWKQHEASEPDEKICGLEGFSKEQVFWLAYGNWFCSKTTEERAVRRIFTDVHAPNPFRILGTVANSKAFREAFDCPVKEPTCDLW